MNVSSSGRQSSYYSNYEAGYRQNRRKRSCCGNFLYHLCCFPPYALFWKGPSWSYLTIKFSKRYASKFWQGRKSSFTTELNTMDTEPRFQPADKETSADKSAESPGVNQLASNLHFVDMLYRYSIGQSTHPAVAVTPDNPDIYENLRVLSCTDGLKRTCWTCDNQICDVSPSFFLTSIMRIA